MRTRSMVSFDWAIKGLLRNKANFEILEGLLSEVLRRKIIIKHLDESEGNQTHKDNKSNKVDALVEADDKELVVIELQYLSQNDYFQRMLYGSSKAITDYIDKGEPYSKIRKVYSINIVYFDLGAGDDYIYHGFNNFTGLHTHTELLLSEKQMKLYGKNLPGELYPEYYIIKVGEFDEEVKDTLDEWVYYLKKSKIRDDFTAQGINKAREVLAYDNLNDKEKKEHDRMIENRRIKDSEINTAFTDGEFKGLEKGEAIGLEKGEAIGLEKGKAIGLEKGEAIGFEKGEAHGLEKGEEIGLEKAVINGKKANYSLDVISNVTGLTVEQIIEILKKYNLL